MNPKNQGYEIRLAAILWWTVLYPWLVEFICVEHMDAEDWLHRYFKQGKSLHMFKWISWDLGFLGRKRWLLLISTWEVKQGHLGAPCWLRSTGGGDQPLPVCSVTHWDKMAQERWSKFHHRSCCQPGGMIFLYQTAKGLHNIQESPES